MNLAIACGGTGGHLFPGVAVGQRLQAMGHTVTLWLSGRDVEAHAVPAWLGSTVNVPARGFNSRLGPASVSTALGLVRAAFQCRARMKATRPDALLAMGSYASVGPVLAARSLGVPVILHEANVVPGRAIAWLCRFATAVAVAFPDAKEHLCGDIRVTGLPLRADLQRNDGRFQLGVDFTVLVSGGSQGAHRLNELTVAALCQLHGGLDEGALGVIHLAGCADAEWVRDRYESVGLPCRVFEFLSDVGQAYGCADLAVSRAGAASCMELAAWGLPALLVPLPSARRDHQTANARAVASVGGAMVLDQDTLEAESLAGCVNDLRADATARAEMSDAIRALAVPDSAEQLAQLVIEVAAP